MPRPVSIHKRVRIGSLSSGTMRPEDLIPEFAYELRRIARRGSGHKALARHAEMVLNSYEALEECEQGAAIINEQLEDALSSLFDALSEYAPAYCDFGSHPGDGADYGFWPDIEAAQEDCLTVSDTSEIPRGYRGYVVQVSDHGNVTLYKARKRGLVQIWGVV